MESNILPSRARRVFLFLGVVFLAANLRAPLTSVGPVIAEISLDLSLSNTAAGFLTTIPLLAFAFLSGIMPRFSNKYGLEVVLFASLVLLGMGLFMRSMGSIFTLFIGAALIGVAITVGNVLMPAYIKKYFSSNVGGVMGVYSAAMNLTAALAAGFSIRLGKIANLGWKSSIGIWILLTLLTMLIWLPQLRKSRYNTSFKEKEKQNQKINLYKSRLAWAITIFMGLQSLLYYCITAWLPKVMQTWGMSVEASGWTLSYVQFAQLPATFLGAIIATRMRDQRFLAGSVGVLCSLGILGLLIFQTKFALICCILIGTGSGLAFSLAMLFFVLRTQNTVHATKLSGMAQSFGYLIAAAGPPVFGGIFDAFHSWNGSFIFLLLLTFILFLAGISAGKNTVIS